MTANTFKMMKEKVAWFGMQPILNDEDAISFPPGSAQQEKFIKVTNGTVNGNELAKKLGLKTAFGTDLIFDPIEVSLYQLVPRVATSWMHVPLSPGEPECWNNAELQKPEKSFTQNY